jgi:hypothetical protein
MSSAIFHFHRDGDEEVFFYLLLQYDITIYYDMCSFHKKLLPKLNNKLIMSNHEREDELEASHTTPYISIFEGKNG